MKPFGTDDDDIELNFILDRNIRVSFAIVDAAYEQAPPLVDDAFSRPLAGDFALPYPHPSQPDRPPKLHAKSDTDDASQTATVFSNSSSLPADSPKSLFGRLCPRRAKQTKDSATVNFF